MIPLYIFLIIWFIFLGLFALLSFISVFQMLRYGIAGVGTYLTTALFLLFTIVTLLGISTDLINVDWEQEVDFFGDEQSVILFTP